MDWGEGQRLGCVAQAAAQAAAPLPMPGSGVSPPPGGGAAARCSVMCIGRALGTAAAPLPAPGAGAAAAAHLHWPSVTVSPSLTRKQGDTCALMFLCLFSYLVGGRAQRGGVRVQETAGRLRRPAWLGAGLGDGDQQREAAGSLPGPRSAVPTAPLPACCSSCLLLVLRVTPAAACCLIRLLLPLLLAACCLLHLLRLLLPAAAFAACCCCVLACCCLLLPPAVATCLPCPVLQACKPCVIPPCFRPNRWPSACCCCCRHGCYPSTAPSSPAPMRLQAWRACGGAGLLRTWRTSSRSEGSHGAPRWSWSSWWT
jgi:hypothetical protein